MPLRKDYGVLGMSPQEVSWKHLGNHGLSSFIFMFSRRFFQVEVGQELRVLIDAWPGEGQRDFDRPSIQLTTPSFRCPESGTGY